MSQSDDAAMAVLALARSRSATLGPGRLICIDGPAGSGKTTLAAALADRDPDVAVVHLDDLLAGWEGLPTLPEQLDPLLGRLAQGRAGSYRRYDYLAGRYAETVTVEPPPMLVLEGVGSGNLRHAPACTVLVWVEVDADLRRRRGLERDGEVMRGHWARWMRDEQAHFADQGTRARADLVM